MNSVCIDQVVIIMMDLVDILKALPPEYAAWIVVAFIILKSFKALLQFHDEYIRTRPFKRLAYLFGESSESATLSKIIVASKHEIIFREIFGTTGSPQFIAAISHLLDSGKFSVTELRAASFYLRLSDGKVMVKLGWGAKIFFWFSLLLVLAMGAYVGLIVVTLLATKSLAGLAAAALIFALLVFFIWLVGSESRSVYVARLIDKKLKQEPSEK